LHQGANSAPVDVAEPLGNVFEQIEDPNTPPEPELLRRAASYSDFYHVGEVRISKESHRQRKAARKERQWDALMLCSDASGLSTQDEGGDLDFQESLESQLLEASQQEYL
jgi:conserved oligomeric Golgi complex subunit 3